MPLSAPLSPTRSIPPLLVRRDMQSAAYTGGFARQNAEAADWYPVSRPKCRVSRPEISASGTPDPNQDADPMQLPLLRWEPSHDCTGDSGVCLHGADPLNGRWITGR